VRSAPEVELFHLVSAADWATRVVGGEYRPASLEAEGFVHLSSADQIDGTVARFYAEVQDLQVLTVDPEALGDLVVWEDLLGHGSFPHCYGPIPLSAVTEMTPWRSTP